MKKMILDYDNAIFRLIKSSLGEVALGIPKKNLPRDILDNMSECRMLFSRIQKARKEEGDFEINISEVLLILSCITFIANYLEPGELHSRTGLFREEVDRGIAIFQNQIEIV